jgi:hypothetical protein
MGLAVVVATRATGRVALFSDVLVVQALAATTVTARRHILYDTSALQSDSTRKERAE